MTEIEFLERKAELKLQAIDCITEEREEILDMISLLRIKGRLENKINQDRPDPILSEKLDCILKLLE